MTKVNSPQNNADNDRSINRLIRAITLSQRNFTLILARCNYADLRSEIVEQLKAQCPVEIRERHLPGSIRTLYSMLMAEMTDPFPQALMIFGLEQVEAIEQVLISTNQVREEFRKNFPFPIVLWVNDVTLKKIVQLMPDFKSWTGNSIKFELASEQLVSTLSPIVDEWIEAILAVGDGKFLSLAVLDPDRADRVSELDAAIADLPAENDLRLWAKLVFLAGREADLRGDKTKAKSDYEESLAIWESLIGADDSGSRDLVCRGLVHLHLGLWWRQYSIQHRSEYQSACEKAQGHYQQSIGDFDQASEPALSAKFINALGEVLVRLEKWAELEKTLPRIVALHEAHSEPIRRAYGDGLSAEVALQKQGWTLAQTKAQQALNRNEERSESSIDWEVDRLQRRNLYLRLLAEAQVHLGEAATAIQNLETARVNSEAQYNPIEHIKILGALRSLYFDQGQYLQAFETKQELRSVEQQYGLRAFVGAGRLQSRRQVVNPGLAAIDARTLVTAEIAASGRSVDVDRLVERLGRTDHKLTVIYGQSGVGKSSLVQAGLLPALKLKSIDARDVVPVLLQVYADWAKSLNLEFTRSMDEVCGLEMPLLQDSMAEFVAEITRSGEKNLLTVLIFDQFEEFFFAYKDPVQRQPFFEFLRNCLNVPYVKVILSLREDYLHYLLECNRLTHLDMINDNILDKNILYYLGNFSPKDAESVIKSLTEESQFPLEDDLVDEMVRDLAGTMNEVRPIELQVVGAQMQTEKLTTLQQYLDRGPKEKLVGRFLEEVVHDCGTNNESFTKIILYLLTDDNLTRPLKTRAELEAELEIPSDRLSLILNILVKSGLIFQIPGFPSDRFQLVHDYLVPFVRQQQAAGMVAELEKERAQRKLTEARLNKVLTEQLKTSKRAMFTLAGLVVAIGTIAAAASITGMNLYFSNMIFNSSNRDERGSIKNLISSVKSGKTYKSSSFIIVPGLHLAILGQLSNVLQSTKQINQLEAHTGTITSLQFSPDERLLATASEDKTAKIWRLADREITTLKGHSDMVTAISFSSNGELIATGSKDKTIKIWDLRGKEILTLEGHQGSIISVTFSPDGKLIATASTDKTVKIWDLNGKKISTLDGHSDRNVISRFSDDSTLIVTGGQFDTTRIWNPNGSIVKNIDEYGVIDLKFDSKKQEIITISKKFSFSIWSIDGNLVKRSTCRDSGSNDKLLNVKNKIVVIASQEGGEERLGFFKVDDQRCHAYPQSSDFPNNYPVTSAVLSDSGRLMASATEDKMIKIWKTGHYFSPNQKGKEIEFKSEKVEQKSVSFNREVLAVVKSDDESENSDNESKDIVQIQDATGKIITSLKGDSSILGFSQDSKSLLLGGGDYSAKLLRPDDKVVTLQNSQSEQSQLVDINFNPNDNRILSTINGRKIKLWNDQGILLKDWNACTKNIKKTIFSPDGQLIASICSENLIKLWTVDGSLIKVIPGHNNFVEGLYFSPNSQILASIGDDNIINLWDRSGISIKSLIQHTEQVTDIQFSPDSQRMLSRSESNEEVKIWDSQNSSLMGEIDSTGNLKFSHTGKYIFENKSGKTLRLWDSSGLLLFTGKGHNDQITTAAISLSENIIATGSLDTTIRIWNTEGNYIRTLKGHSSAISGIAFSPDEKLLASVSKDGQVYIWDVSTGRSIVIFSDNLQNNKETIDLDSNQGNDISFSDDGKTITLISSYITNYGRGYIESYEPYYEQKYVTSIWDLSNRKQLKKSKHLDLPHQFLTKMVK